LLWFPLLDPLLTLKLAASAPKNPPLLALRCLVPKIVLAAVAALLPAVVGDGRAIPDAVPLRVIPVAPTAFSCSAPCGGVIIVFVMKDFTGYTTSQSTTK
jgi:hypothetical protein